MSNKNLSDSIYKEAWVQLYNAFGERMQDEELELMDNILQCVNNEYEERLDAISNKASD